MPGDNAAGEGQHEVAPAAHAVLRNFVGVPHTLSFSTVAQTVNATSLAPQTSSDSSNLTVNLFVPVMFHPATHFFLGFGPALDADATGDVKTTTVAGRLTIGGWI